MTLCPMPDVQAMQLSAVMQVHLPDEGEAGVILVVDHMWPLDG